MTVALKQMTAFGTLVTISFKGRYSTQKGHGLINQLKAGMMNLMKNISLYTIL